MTDEKSINKKSSEIRSDNVLCFEKWSEFVSKPRNNETTGLDAPLEDDGFIDFDDYDEDEILSMFLPDVESVILTMDDYEEICTAMFGYKRENDILRQQLNELGESVLSEQVRNILETEPIEMIIDNYEDFKNLDGDEDSEDY